jgi:soluble lytic murein transglycosylase-like protein
MLVKALSISVLACSALLSSSAAKAELNDKKVEKIIIAAAHKVEVPQQLLLAVCWIESEYKSNLPEKLDGHTPSYGICQVKLETAQFMDKFYKHKNKVTVEKLRDPYINAFYAAKYIQWQLNQYGNDWKKAVAAYNRGSYTSDHPNHKYVRRVQLALEERGLASFYSSDW